VLKKFFADIDKDQNAKLSSGEILEYFSGLDTPQFSDLKLKLDDELQSVDSKSGIDVEKFSIIAQKYGIATGQRSRWAHSLNLDGLLASRLKVGQPFDELRGVKEMSDREVDALLQTFFSDISRVFKSELELLKESEAAGSDTIVDARNKFTGYVGKFGDTEMFQEGLESQLGSPDPSILKGILNEHSSTKRNITSNYKINFSEEQEYASIFGNPHEYEKNEGSGCGQFADDIPIYMQEVFKGLHPSIKGPDEADLNDLRDRFTELRTRFKDILEKNNGVFPGEFGHVHKSIDVKIEVKNLEFLKELLKLLKQKENEYEECYAAIIPDDRLKNLLIQMDEESHLSPDAVRVVAQWLDTGSILCQQEVHPQVPADAPPQLPPQQASPDLAQSISRWLDTEYEKDEILRNGLSQCNEFTFSVYGPLRGFYLAKLDHNLIQELNLAGLNATLMDSKVYIYCNVHSKDEKMIREIIVGKHEANTTAEGEQEHLAETGGRGGSQSISGKGDPKFSIAELAYILCEPETKHENSEGSASDYIERIVVESLKPKDSKIELVQARRRLSLRELMDIELVRKSGLRIEEALQAYQYTGPLFQVCFCHLLESLMTIGLTYLRQPWNGVLRVMPFEGTPAADRMKEKEDQ
jgi:hypothetical protein